MDNAESAKALGIIVQNMNLAVDIRESALDHMLNLSTDEETNLLLPLLNSDQLPDTLAQTILTDSLNRSLDWQADACLAIMARKTGKELHAWAREHLAFLTDENRGDDLNGWQSAVRSARARWKANNQ